MAGSPRTVTDRLQCLLNAAARVVSNTGQFDRGLTHLLHSELHWLDVPQWILHKLRVTVHRCLQGRAPQYLMNCCHPTSDVASRQRLRSSSHHHLVVPRHRRSTLGRRAFSIPGPMAWRPPRPVAQSRQFQEEAKDAYVSGCTWTLSALEALRNALYKFKTYLLTYLSRTSGPNREQRSRKIKIGTEVVHVTCDSDTTFKVKRSTCRGRWHIVAASRTACFKIVQCLTKSQSAAEGEEGW